MLKVFFLQIEAFLFDLSGNEKNNPTKLMIFKFDIFFKKLKLPNILNY